MAVLRACPSPAIPPPGTHTRQGSISEMSSPCVTYRSREPRYSGPGRDDLPPPGAKKALATKAHWLPVWLPHDEHGSENIGLNCAPSRIRTCGLLLGRHSPDDAGCRRVWPDVAFSCTDSC